MKIIKVFTVLFCCYTLCVSCICMDNHLVIFYYDPQNEMLYLSNQDSGGHIRRLEMRMNGDTLLFEAPKRLYIFRSNWFEDALYSNWKIKMKEEWNVKFVQCGDKKMRLSDIKPPSKRIVSSYYPCIEISPDKFPYITK